MPNTTVTGFSFFRENTTAGWLSRRYFRDDLLLMFLVRDPGVAGLRINRTFAGCLTDNFPKFIKSCQTLAKHSPTFCNRFNIISLEVTKSRLFGIGQLGERSETSRSTSVMEATPVFPLALSGLTPRASRDRRKR